MEYKNISKRYSPKEVLAHVLRLTNKECDDNFENTIKEIFSENVYNNSLLYETNLEYVEKIKNYWSLTKEQAISYCFVVWNNLKIEEKNMTEIEIVKMFVYVMKTYTPDNAEEMLKYGHIINKEYSTKELLAYLINMSTEGIDDDMTNIKDIILNSFKDKEKSKKILEELDENIVKRIPNSWNITKEQAVCYSYIVFKLLQFEKKVITVETITDTFVIVMRLYSPNNATEYIKEKYRKSQV